MSDELEKSKAQNEKSGKSLPKREFDVLKYFFDEDRNMTAGEIASRFGVQSSIAKRSIDILFDFGWLERRQNLTELHISGSTDGFVITAIGRLVIEEFPPAD